MSLPRQDVRFYLDSDSHARLKRLCAIDDIELAAFVEREIVAIVDREFHRAAKLVDGDQDHPGTARSGPESSDQAPARDLPFARRER